MSTYVQNPYFRAKIDHQLNLRMHCVAAEEKPRRCYHDDFLNDWDFKDDVVKWLLESDHHQGFRMKNDELRKQLSEKDARLKQLEERESRLVFELRRAKELTKLGASHPAMSRPAAGHEDAFKRLRPNPPNICGAAGVSQVRNPPTENRQNINHAGGNTLSALQQFSFNNIQSLSRRQVISPALKEKLNRLYGNCTIF